ncbi:MAG: nuclear transport factor 2 family protein [Polyangiaceae bacterium]|nr:nuclear transport factor 2 family protein [Polyangiaceae bacterium]
MMLRPVVALLAVTVAAGCSPACPECAVAPSSPVASTSTNGSIEKEEHAIAGVLDDWHDAAAKADEERYFSHLHEASVFLGTDATERWDKKAFRAYSHPHFAKGKAWTFRSKRRAIVIDPRGDLAHFDEDLETAGLGPARGSGVLAKVDGRWQILQYNLAITVPNERFDLAKEAASGARVLASAGKAAIDDLAFLSGAWIGTTKSGETVEEHWTNAAAGSLLGSGRTSKDGKRVFFEHLRIEERPDGSIVYVAQPLGKSPTEFKRTSAPSKTEAVFENPKHDWPKKITYKRVGRTLEVRVEGGPKQPVETWTMEQAIVERITAK